ncbi:MAG: PolC-type DNA polymerase III [Clostridia bacterium]|nr:PolC-type DNA polymerase III [Clostridia bacterium]
MDFFSKKYILTRPSFTGSSAEIVGNKLNVTLGNKGKFLLLQKNVDKTVSDFVFNTTGNRFEVEFFEPDNIDFAMSREQMQDNLIKNMIDENAKRAQEIQLQKNQEELKKKEKKARNKIEKQIEDGSIDKIVDIPANVSFPTPSDEELNSLLASVDNARVWEVNSSGVVEVTPQVGDGTSVTNIVSGQVALSYRQNNDKPKQFSGHPVRRKTDANIKDPEKLIFKGWKDTPNPKGVKIIDLAQDTPCVIISGEVSNFDSRETKNGSMMVSFDIYDGTSSINCKAFLKPEEFAEAKPRFKSAKALRVVGTYEYNSFSKEFGINADVIEEAEYDKVVRMDEAEEKRVELHMHTQMSQMDGVTSATDLIKRAISWGHKAIAITDHGVVQAFPEANKAAKGSDIKVIYGVEAYLVPDGVTSIYDYRDDQTLKDETYCILDIETTGISKLTERITEFGIMKVKDGEVIDTFECFVNPEMSIPERVVEITGITDEMVKDAETIDVVLPKVIEFCKDTTIVAHNANFDIGFIRENARRLGLEFNYPWIDTLALAKELFPERKKFKLGLIAEDLGIEVDVAHRALADVDTLKKVFDVMLQKLDEKEIVYFKDVDKSLAKDVSFKTLPVYHAIVLVTNKIGLKNLYKLVSFAHLNYFYKKPRTLKSLLKKYSEGLLIGSACEQGELYRAIEEGKSDEELEEIADFYDYLEIQPLGNNLFKARENKNITIETLQNYNKKIVALGEKLNKPVVATCDVHFMDPEDELYRRILMAGQGYDDADNQAPLYLRTTEEMLREFGYLGKEKAYEVVVTNTNKIADMCEKISPIADYKAAPHIEGCEETIRNITMNRAHELYGEVLPEIVEQRIDKELDSIIKNGFSVMYIIAQKLVKKSNEDGYIVGSRGSVGSSLVAYLTGITEVNSLRAHYRCPNCKYSDFTDYGVKNGFDLPDKICPNCGRPLAKDGMDIPFETFLGFDGDKEPDIDLNFSGEYQAKAHKYTEVIFGKGTTFKAGTVGTIADKTAFGYVKKYYEERHKVVNSAEIVREAAGCTGVKRTTGQHPGGIIVVPVGHEIYEFCPAQHPADDPDSDIITTHFDYHSIDQNLLKLDILGHDDPTVIRMLQDLTGIDPRTVPLDDKETMSIFESTKALGVEPNQIKSEVGTYGVPEFGTKFVRGMLVDTKPTKFEELLRISGLSHGTDVWLNNAQTLIQEGTIKLEDAICTRDDIMIYLIGMGLPPKPAFKIMESVRKGKGLTEEQEALMKEHDVPDWYISSCKKIKYMFPKAHAAAYVTNAFRIAWFKVHVPRAYYTAYFSIRADGFDSDIMAHGKERVIEKMREIDSLGKLALPKDQDMYPVLEIVLEFYERGYNFLDIDLYKSDAIKFTMEDEGIRPPLNSIPGLGTVAAQSIQASREKDGEFMSVEELMLRAGIGKSTAEILKNAGCLKGMTWSNQMSLFAL